MNEHIPQTELQKREEQKRQMKEALENQMMEKKRKKEEERRQLLEDHKREEERIKKENEELLRRAELEKEQIYQKTQARFNQMSQMSHPQKNSEPEQKKTNEQFEKSVKIQETINPRTSAFLETEKASTPIYIKPTAEPKKLISEIPHEKLSKLEEDNVKLKEVNTKQGEIIDMLLNVFKVKNPEQLSTSKFLDEVTELRSKQLQGQTQQHQQQKAMSSQKQNQVPYYEEMPEHQYATNKKNPKANYQHPMSQQHSSEHIPTNGDVIGHRYLKSSEESSLHRQYQMVGVNKPPINPRGGYSGVDEDDHGFIRRQHFDQVPRGSYMNGFDYSQQAREINPLRIYSSPGHSANFKQSFVQSSFIGLRGPNFIDQKERMLMSEQPYKDIGVYQDPSQMWNEDGAPYDPNAFSLKHSKSDIRFLREQSALDNHEGFQPPDFEQYQRQFGGGQPRNLPMHSNIMPNYHGAVYKPPSIVNEFSVKFPMDSLKQTQTRIPGGFAGPNPISIVDDANGTRSSGLSPNVYNASRNLPPNFYMEAHRDQNINDPRDIGSKYPRQQNQFPVYKNYTDSALVGGFASEGRNTIPTFPKDIFNSGAKKKSIA